MEENKEKGWASCEKIIIATTICFDILMENLKNLDFKNDNKQNIILWWIDFFDLSCRSGDIKIPKTEIIEIFSKNGYKPYIYDKNINITSTLERMICIATPIFPFSVYPPDYKKSYTRRVIRDAVHCINNFIYSK